MVTAYNSAPPNRPGRGNGIAGRKREARLPVDVIP